MDIKKVLKRHEIIEQIKDWTIKDLKQLSTLIDVEILLKDETQKLKIEEIEL